MLEDKNIDSRALKMLLKYNTLAATYVALGHPLDVRKKEYVEKHGTSADDMECMKLHGLAFDFTKIDHDEAVQKCFEYYGLLHKKHVTDLFLASLSSNRLDWRSGLPAYALMQTMPKHSFVPNAAKCCEVCSGREREARFDLTALNQERFAFGTLIAQKTPYQVQFFLLQFSKLPPVTPTDADFAIFNEIISLIGSLDDDAKPNDVKKDLRTVKNFKASLDQSRFFLEILGLASILETEKDRGYLTKYTNPGLAPSKSHSSNWAYPVDFWTGKDGVNREALRFWFGEYKKVKS